MIVLILPKELRCQSCRFKKCIEVGMNSKALELNETEKEALNFKKLAELEKEKIPTIQTIISKENLSKNIIDMLCYLELKIDQFKNSAYNPSIIDWMKTTEELVTRENKLSLADHLGPMSGWPINRKMELPKVSRMRDVPDIDMKYSGSTARPVPSPANQKMWMFFNMMTFIEYAKTFKFFQKLDLNDQLVLIGQNTLLCMNLHNSYYAVSRKMEKCVHPDGTEQPQRDEYHYPVVSMALAPLIRCDIQLIEYILLKAISLCNPTVHGLSEHGQTIIAKERQQFSDVLLDHCLRNRSYGPSRFVELLEIISVLVRQQRLQKDIHIYHISPIISKFPFSVQFLDEIMYS
ncbi:Protein CBG06732 [Caenorhabditis briggsae]|uniref:Protein CBG06732 n=1 Tax=Caenorhabditis briggsae TaxID=6238 RepID=A8X2Z0_CAEBR|nr:Protein CBG06732 [Caenorhabditis briggsae]CAP27000.2 Protein CBG06732 [Caenorhabditis briggsae]